MRVQVLVYFMDSQSFRNVQHQRYSNTTLLLYYLCCLSLILYVANIQ